MTMPVQGPQWTEFLSCSVCFNVFNETQHRPISLGCGHTVCKSCLARLQQSKCPFDQSAISSAVEELPVNYALLQLVGAAIPDSNSLSIISYDSEAGRCLESATRCIEKLAVHLKPIAENNKPAIEEEKNIILKQQPQRSTGGNVVPSTGNAGAFLLSRPMQRKLVTLINCQLVEEEGRARAMRATRSLGERTVTELILQHQNPQQLSANLWAAVRARGCQFLGPAMQEEVLKLILLALEDGSALSRKVLVLFVVQRLESQYPQASKTAIGHVVQLLYRASCFMVTKREEESSLMQLKEEFRSYEALRREHDSQIVQIAMEAGLRISPEQWSSLLYGDGSHKSHMQSIIDKLQTPQSFAQSVSELLLALQRTGDPCNLQRLRPHFDLLANIDPTPDALAPSWENLEGVLHALHTVVEGLVDFLRSSHMRRTEATPQHNARYKTSLCRDLAQRGVCPRSDSCTFAHSQEELEKYRARSKKFGGKVVTAMPNFTAVTPKENVELPQVQQTASEKNADAAPEPEFTKDRSAVERPPSPEPLVSAVTCLAISSPATSNTALLGKMSPSPALTTSPRMSTALNPHAPTFQHSGLQSDLQLPPPSGQFFRSGASQGVVYPQFPPSLPPRYPPQPTDSTMPPRYSVPGSYPPMPRMPASQGDQWVGMPRYSLPEEASSSGPPPPFPLEPFEQTLYFDQGSSEDLESSHHLNSQTLNNLRSRRKEIIHKLEKKGVQDDRHSRDTGHSRKLAHPTELPVLRASLSLAKSVSDTYVAARTTMSLASTGTNQVNNMFIPVSSNYVPHFKTGFLGAEGAMKQPPQSTPSAPPPPMAIPQSAVSPREICSFSNSRAGQPCVAKRMTESCVGVERFEMDEKSLEKERPYGWIKPLQEDSKCFEFSSWPAYDGGEDIFIPFGESPTVSKYGPISRTARAKPRNTDPVQVIAMNLESMMPVSAITPLSRPLSMAAPVESRYTKVETVTCASSGSATSCLVVSGPEPLTLWNRGRLPVSYRNTLKRDIAVLGKESLLAHTEKERLEYELQAIELSISLQTGHQPTVNAELHGSAQLEVGKTAPPVSMATTALPSGMDRSGELCGKETQQLRELHTALEAQRQCQETLSSKQQQEEGDRLLAQKLMIEELEAQRQVCGHALSWELWQADSQAGGQAGSQWESGVWITWSTSPDVVSVLKFGCLSECERGDEGT